MQRFRLGPRRHSRLTILSAAIGVVLILGMTLAVGIPRLVHAQATYLVSTCTSYSGGTTPPTAGTFAAALAAAQDGDTITFTCAGTIAIASTISITKAITITRTAGSVVLDGGGTAQIMSITTPSAGGRTVTLDGITFAHGSASGATPTGGAINISGSTVIINGGLFTQDQATTTSASPSTIAAGGAIYNINGDLTLRNVNFSYDSAHATTGTAEGGAVANLGSGSVTVSTTTFFSDSATSANVGQPSSVGGSLGGAVLNHGSQVTVSSSTFSNDTASGNGTIRGGAIANDTNLSLTQATFTNDSAASTNAGSAFGGALSIIGSGNTQINASTFSTNAISGTSGGSAFGGAIDNDGSTAAIAQIAGSTFNGNRAAAASAAGFSPVAAGGAMNNDGAATTTIINSTFAGDSASGAYASFGGALNTSSDDVTVTNSTIAGNSITGGTSGAYGVDVAASSGALTLANSIIGNGTVGAFDCYALSSASIADGGHNVDQDHSCGFTGASDIINANPGLGALANNGGPTLTMALLDGSPAINAGGSRSNGCPAADQRNIPRPQGTSCDIGAFEFVPTTSTALVVAPNPASLGQTVTLTATVTGGSGQGTPIHGTVTFLEGTTALGTASLTTSSNGVARLTYTWVNGSSDIGMHNLTASYSGDTDYSGSTSSPYGETVTKAATSTTLGAVPVPATYPQSVTLTAQVSGVSGVAAPTGTVTFSNGSTTLGTGTLAVVAGQDTATFTAAGLGGGTHNIVATYSGDSNYTGSNGGAAIGINKANSTTSASASPNSVTLADQVTLKAVVTGAIGGAIPTGPVTFAVGGTTAGVVTLSGGVATLSVTTLPAGSDVVTATYGGDGNYNGSYSTVTVTVHQAPSRTSLATTPNPAILGQPIALQATVAGIIGMTPTGTVTFKDGATTLGSASLDSGGVATFTSTLALGGHSFTAAYNGDANYLASSGTATDTVNQAPSTTALTITPSVSSLGSMMTLKATVSGVSWLGTPSGIVSFAAGPTNLGSAALSSGVAAVGVSSLGVGSGVITATYAGDASYLGSSNAAGYTVTQAASTTTLTAIPTTGPLGTAVTLTATVAGVSSEPTPGGSVTFTDGLTSVGTATMIGGQAALTVSTLAVGSHSLTASYSGDANYWPSSGTASDSVSQASTTTTLIAGPSPATLTQSVTLTATIMGNSGGPTPGGSVTFKDGSATLGSGTLDSGGMATLTASTLTLGSHSLSAVYAGDSNYLGSTGVASLTINKAPSATSLVLTPIGSTRGSSATLSASVTGISVLGAPTGTVTFSVGGITLGTATLSGGKASITTTALSVGDSTVSASYGGDTQYLASQSTANATITAASSSTALATSPPYTVFGQSVTLTANVSGASHGPMPTGTVTFKAGTTTLGTGTLDTRGTATFSTTTLAVGTHALSATYSGDTSYAGSSGGTSLSVSKAGTTIILTIAAPSTTTGQQVRFTASVHVTAPGVGTFSGTITFMDGSTTLALSSISHGAATFTATSLSAGDHRLSAVYSGDTSFSTSTSPAQPLKITAPVVTGLNGKGSTPNAPQTANGTSTSSTSGQPNAGTGSKLGNNLSPATPVQPQLTFPFSWAWAAGLAILVLLIGGSLFLVGRRQHRI